MVTASVRFLTNNLVADLTCKNTDLKSNLESIGILTPLSVMRLDNARLLQIELTPNDNVGELICGIINTKSDTLGDVQRFCRHIHCMNEQHKETVIKKLENGDIKTLKQGIKICDKIREEKNMSR